MKKILVVQETLVGGGAERVLIDTLDKFDYSKYEVHLLLLRNQGVYLNKINKNVKVKYIFSDFDNKKGLDKTLSWKMYNFTLKYLYKWVVNKYLKDDYDVVIGFLEGFSSLLVSEYNGVNAKKIVWVHNDLSKLKTITESMDGKIYNNVDKIVCVSNDSKKSLINLYPNIKEKVQVIYNLINIENIKSLSEENLDEDFKKPVLLGIGRLNTQKRFDVMIESHKLLIDDGIENELIILGEGTEEKKLRELIDKLGVNNSVKILGFKSNPYKYIKQADVFVMSSDFEGLPVVICESLVLGKAIVATKCTGPSELLNNGEYGVLVECNNPENIKEEVKKILSDKELKLDLEKKSIERSKIFNSKKVIKEIYDLIDN